MKKIKLFVYGSLMSEMSNNYILKGSDLLREAKTKGEYTMIDMGAFPAIVQEGYRKIKGEVYIIDQHTLKRVDFLEGHPYFYKRQMIKLENGEQVVAYLLNDDLDNHEKDIVATGDWREKHGGKQCHMI